jgi:hypothetical protein
MVKLFKGAYKECKETAMSRGNRKYALLLICFGMLSAGLLVSGFLPAAATQYTTFVGGITFLYGVYCSGNVAAKWSPVAATDEPVITKPGKKEKPANPEEES